MKCAFVPFSSVALLLLPICFRFTLKQAIPLLFKISLCGGKIGYYILSVFNGYHRPNGSCR